ncbi:MAG: surfeit locus 1 family protein [Actinomycetota bacterium]|nr:surfeit locus 1 family protein [Actinomycetota bacterium]
MTLLRPRWVAGHLLVLVLSAGFIALGFWQLARNHHKQSLVRAARAAYAAPAPDITRNPVVAPGNRVQLSGRYDPAHSVLLRNRVHGGKDGNDVLTPLLLDDGSGVIVDRGWVAAVGDGRAPIAGVTPTGPVVVRGILHRSSTLSAQDAVTSSGGQLALPKVDTGRINLDLSYQLLPRWIEAQSQTPAPAAGAPALPQPPPPDQVNHMQYAIQWFSFAAICVIGWPVALISIARRGGFSTPDRGDERDHGEH